MLLYSQIDLTNLIYPHAMMSVSATELKRHPWAAWVGLLGASLITVGLLVAHEARAHIAYPYEVEHRAQRQYYQAPPVPRYPTVLSAEVEEFEEPAKPTVDPQELKSVRQQVSERLSEIKRLKGLAQKGKLTEVLEELNALEAKLRQLQAKLKTVPLDEAREVMEEFYQERYHDQINPLQQKIELPDEIKNVVGQINDLRREVKNLRKQAKINKVGGLDDEFNAFEAKFADVPAKLKATPLDEAREVLEEFYRENYWEQLNPLRVKIELPKELKELERRLRESEKMVANKSVLKALAGLGIKVEAVKNKLTEMRAAYEAAKNLLAAGDFEDLEETLQPLREIHSGMVNGMLQGVREVWSRIRQVRDLEVRDALIRFLAPVVNAINEGDYEELTFIQEEIGEEFDRLLEKALRANLRGRTRSDFLERLQQLDSLIEGKLDEREAQEAAQPESAPQPVHEVAPVPEVPATSATPAPPAAPVTPPATAPATTTPPATLAPSVTTALPAPTWSNIKITNFSGDGNANYGEYPAVAYDGITYGIVWKGSDGVSTAENIFFTAVYGSGAKAAGPIPITNHVASSVLTAGPPAIAFGTLWYGVAWVDNPLVNGQIQGQVMRFATVDRSGNRMADLTLSQPSDNAAMKRPGLRWTVNGFAITWESSSGTRYYAQVANNGQSITVDKKIATTAEWDAVATPEFNGSVTTSGNNIVFTNGDVTETVSTVGGTNSWPALAWTRLGYAAVWQNVQNNLLQIYFAVR